MRSFVPFILYFFLGFLDDNIKPKEVNTKYLCLFFLYYRVGENDVHTNGLT